MKLPFLKGTLLASTLAAPLSTFAHEAEEGAKIHHSGMMNFGTWGIGSMWITQILVWALLVAAIFALITWAQKR